MTLRFSLITATVDRTEDVFRLCESLQSQHHRDFELILVDQNEDDRLLPIVGEFRKRMSIVHLRCARGLSRARNIGLAAAAGRIVAFPDDDCVYQPDLLSNLARVFEDSPNLDGATCAALTETGELHRRWPKQGSALTRFNLFRRSISYSIFLRTGGARVIVGFDVALGLGSGRTPWLGDEEHDFLIRGIIRGFSFVYFPQFGVIHPDRSPRSEATHLARKYGESMAIMWEMKKYQYPLWFAIYIVGLSVGGLCVSAMRGDVVRMRSYYAGLRGKIYGWRQPIATRPAMGS